MIGEIETAIVTRILSASSGGHLGYKLKTVASYGGQFDSDQELKKALPGMPGAWVTLLRDRKDREIVNGLWRMKAEFAIIVAATSKRNEAARRHGAAGAVGVYQIARDIRILLADQKLGLEMDYLTPEGARTFPLAVAEANSVGILAVEFSTTYQLMGSPDIPTAALPPHTADDTLLAGLNRAAGVTDFALAHVDWDAPLAKSDDVTLERPPA